MTERSLMQEGVDQRMGHRMRVSADSIDVLVGQAIGLAAERFATAREGQQVQRIVPFVLVLHGRDTSCMDRRRCEGAELSRAIT